MAFSQNPPCGQCAELIVAESAGGESLFRSKRGGTLLQKFLPLKRSDAFFLAGMLQREAHFDDRLHAARGVDHVGHAIAGQHQQTVIGAQARVADNGNRAVLGHLADSGGDFFQRDGVPVGMFSCVALPAAAGRESMKNTWFSLRFFHKSMNWSAVTGVKRRKGHCRPRWQPR